MKTTRGAPARPALPRRPGRGPAPPGSQLAESAEALRAIRSGEVDAVLLAGKDGDQVFTLQGAEHAYRVLIESMNEGALTLTAGEMILYANQAFARMVRCPLEQVIGSSFRRFLSVADRTALRVRLQRPGRAGVKIQLRLNAGDGSHLAAQISIRPLARNGQDGATLCIVVTDMTEARRNEEMLRALTHRVVQVQEIERGRVAVELHDNITQLLCAVLFRSQALADGIPAGDGPARKEATQLREILGRTADEVERITRNLRPGMLEQLGLVEVLRDTTKDFAAQTGLSLKLDCATLAARLPAGTELALYRILQEALKNVQQHAGAQRLSVSLKQRAAFVQLVIKDDGAGFDSDRRLAGQRKRSTLGLLGMRERASCVGGSFEITSAPRKGTEIEVRIPVSPPDDRGGVRSGRAPAITRHPSPCKRQKSP